MASYQSDHQIRASLNAQKRLKIFNPSLDTVYFEYEGKKIPLHAQEIADLPYSQALIAKKALIDHLLNKTSSSHTTTELQIAEFEREILI